MPSTCLSHRMGGGLLLGPIPGCWVRLVPAVIHDFFILQLRVCEDLTAVEQHNACYLPEPRDGRGPLLCRIPGVAEAHGDSCYS
jgi:hypothetical protein